MKKFLKAVSILTAVLMFAAAMPLSSFAVNELDYDVYVGGVKMTAENCNDVFSDGGSVKYDAALKTLTLTNAAITQVAYLGNITPQGYFGIVNDEELLNIVLVGDNRIDMSGLVPNDASTARVNGIVINSGSISFGGSGSLYIKTPGGVHNSSGIDTCYYNGSGSAVRLKGGCSVEIHTGDATLACVGIDTHSGGNIYVEEGSKLTVCTGDTLQNDPAMLRKLGIFCGGIYVSDASAVYVKNGDLPQAAAIQPISNWAIGCSSVNIINSSLTAIAGKAGGCEGSESVALHNINDLATVINSKVELSAGDRATDLIIAVNDATKYTGVEFFSSESADGSNLSRYEKEYSYEYEYPYLLIAPEGTVELPEKTFFEKLSAFFQQMFERIARFFSSLL